jgi:hypothetical protein
MDDSVSQQDLELARSVSREARADPNSPYAGKYIGILDGEVVVIADSPEDGLRELRKFGADPNEGLLVDTSVDHDVLHEIWGM